MIGPPGVKFIAIFTMNIVQNATTGFAIEVWSPDQAPSGYVLSVAQGSSVGASGQFHIRTNTSGAINYVGSGLISGGWYVWQQGYIDYRGK
jgi:hypothetical protein